MQREIALREVKRAPTRVADLQRTLSFALHNGYYELLLLHMVGCFRISQSENWMLKELNVHSQKNRSKF